MIKIVLGYVIILAYVLSLIFVLGPILNKRSSQEASRKVVHILLFFVWILIDLFLKDTIHQIIIPVIFLILNTLSYKFGIYKSVEREERNHPGTVYFAIAITVILTVAYFFPRWYYCSGIATFCLTFGDGFAALVGYHTKSRKLREHKSIYGTLACTVASFLSLIGFVRVYDLDLNLLQILAISLLAAILELASWGADNFTVVAGTFVLSYFFLMTPSTGLLWSVLIAELVFILVFLSKAIDYWGTLLAMGMVFAYSYLGGAFALIYFLAAYFIIFAVSRIKTRILGFPRKAEGRNFWQILINGGAGLLFVVLYGVTGVENCLVVGLICVGGCFIDSLSSDVGVLSRREPVDILKWKPVAKGVSGGVSLVGLAAAAVGAAVFALSIGLFTHLGVLGAALAFVLMFGQSIIDSLLGSILQAKFRCTQCGKVTDHPMHCDSSAQFAGGVKWIDNSAVNLISTVVIALIGCGIFLI